MRFLICIGLLLTTTAHTAQSRVHRCGVHHPSNAGPITSEKAYSREAIEIPVVFHIVYRTTEENLTEERILSQLEVLNEDYNASNEDLSVVPDEFKNDIGNAQITFCLASIDPNGSSSNGIVRVRTREEGIADQGFQINNLRAIKNDQAGGSSPWDTQRYLNIWIGQRTDGILGDATFPDSEDPGEIDGVVVDYRAVGRYDSDNFAFHLGRTLTHEIAHFLNVYHLFGSETGCFSDGDFVEDTPTQFGRYFGPCEGPVFSCDSRDMDMNFLNFRDDDCLVFFSKGQVQRMRETLFTARYELITSGICSQRVPIPDDPLKIARILSQRGRTILDLSTLANREYKIELFDINGRFMETRQSNGANTYRFNHDTYPSGVYIFRLTLEDQYWVRKVYLD